MVGDEHLVGFQSVRPIIGWVWGLVHQLLCGFETSIWLGLGCEVLKPANKCTWGLRPAVDWILGSKTSTWIKLVVWEQHVVGFESVAPALHGCVNGFVKKYMLQIWSVIGVERFRPVIERLYRLDSSWWFSLRSDSCCVWSVKTNCFQIASDWQSETSYRTKVRVWDQLLVVFKVSEMKYWMDFWIWGQLLLVFNVWYDPLSEFGGWA